MPNRQDQRTVTNGDAVLYFSAASELKVAHGAAGFAADGGDDNTA
jgi:hypothetical protein